MFVDSLLQKKRKDVLNFLKKKKYSIYFLQDTHFTKEKKRIIFEANGASNASLAAFPVNLAVWLYFLIIISNINFIMFSHTMMVIN